MTSLDAPPNTQLTAESGVYRSVPKRIDELDEAFEGLDELEEVQDELEAVPGELEEVHDEEEELPDLPDIPSLMPAHPEPHQDPIARAQRPVPVFEMELEVPVSRPHQAMITTRSSANMAAVRPPQAMITTSSTANMAAVRPPPAAMPAAPMGDGRVLDSFEDEVMHIALDIKAPPTSHSVLTTISGLEVTAAPPSEGVPVPVSSTQKAVDPRPGIVAFAGFGLPPENLGGTPAYAVRVLARKWALRDDLRVARLRRIQDVSLYEAALECADESAVTRGLALIAVTVAGTLSAVVAAAAFLL